MLKEYAEEYVVYDQATGDESSRKLDFDPYFMAAAGAAKELKDGDTRERIACRSSEYDAIKNVLAGLPNDAIPERIGTSAPYVLCGDPPRKPWWRLWGQS